MDLNQIGGAGSIGNYGMNRNLAEAQDIKAGGTGAQGDQVNPNDIAAMQVSSQSNGQVDGKAKDVSDERVAKAIHEVNKEIGLLNEQVRFQVHKASDRIMVQVVDTDKNEVVKEFPPREFLDTIGQIRKYIGILLDKKA